MYVELDVYLHPFINLVTRQRLSVLLHALTSLPLQKHPLYTHYKREYGSCGGFLHVPEIEPMFLHCPDRNPSL
jgi:hypothetical protein